ncbi:serine palmitoyltransferase component [Puccinia graminis f. sp. tritici]|uniref:serine C-palmitoyltransferase n=1 Tax=Puccinia graminis f. sp. tritici TaxID=56615 RepID=A0A5B0RGY4_PUCGR|nr:serine palmitoyltransferase component [Puccinia graminis f. sp. tritici]
MVTDRVEETLIDESGLRRAEAREDASRRPCSSAKALPLNSTTFPAIAAKGTLIISDEFNHSSIRFGSRLSGGMVRQYKHNDMNHLAKLLRESISQGQPRTHRPWKKIIVVVEGIYSMEGTIVNLPALYALKAIYKFYLYVDEAHSIGALGPRGRGVCDYFGLDPEEIDIMMGTLTKSFGASGGYIAGKASIIRALRAKNHSSVYGPPSRLANPHHRRLIRIPPRSSLVRSSRRAKNAFVDSPFNARYLSSGLRKLGFIVYGDRDSPIIPLLIFHPGKMLQFSRMMLERYAIVVVVVAYPATPLVSSRVRFCVSASHTKEDIDKILIATDQIGELLGLKMSKRNGFLSNPSALTHPIVNLDGNQRWDIQTVLDNSLALVLY